MKGTSKINSPQILAVKRGQREKDFYQGEEIKSDISDALNWVNI